jgi:hypothetical protein
MVNWPAMPASDLYRGKASFNRQAAREGIAVSLEKQAAGKLGGADRRVFNYKFEKPPFVKFGYCVISSNHLSAGA